MTVLDIAFVSLMLISALLAMMRGFTREVLTIVAWGAAAGAALYAYFNFQSLVQAQIQPKIIANAVLVGGTFLVVLVIVSLVSMKLSDMILDSKVGAVDRVLGFVFGVGRGLLIAAIAFQVYIRLGADEQKQPNWVRNARFKPLLTNTGNQLYALLPEDLEKTIINPAQPGESGDTAGTPPSDPPDDSPDSLEQR